MYVFYSALDAITAVREAMEDIERATCISFKDKSFIPADELATHQYILISSSGNRFVHMRNFDLFQ